MKQQCLSGVLVLRLIGASTTALAERHHDDVIGAS